METRKNSRGQWSLDKKTTAAFALAFILLVTVGVKSHTQLANFEKDTWWVAHTYEVMAVIEDAEDDVYEAQAGMHNYVLSGNERYRKACRAAAQAARRKLQRLRTLTADNPDQQRRLGALEPLIDKRLGLLEERIGVRENQGFEAALERIRNDPGIAIMEDVSSRFGEMKDTEDALLQRRVRESNADARRTTITLTASVLLAVALIAAAMLLVNRNVARREAAEATWRNQTRLQQSILENIADGVAVADERGRFVLFNPAAEQILGIGVTDAKPGEWTGHYGLFLPDMVTPCPTDDLPLVRALRGESMDGAELFVRNPKQPDGVWIAVSGRPLRDEAGAVRGGVVVFQNVTEQKRAHETLEARVRERTSELARINAELEEEIAERRRTTNSLRASEERYRRIIDTTPDGIWSIDANCRTTFVNRRMAQMLGYAEDEMLGQPLFKFMHGEAQRCAAANVERRRNGIAEQHDFQFQRKDGGDLWTIVSAAPIFEDGRYAGSLGVITDISERRRLEDQLRQAQKMEIVGQLAGGVAHDFNNLLTVISGYSEMMLASLPSDDRNRELIQEIYKAGERAASLTRQLLAFSRKQIIAPKVLDLNAIVGEAGKMLQRLIGEDVSMTTVLAPDLGRVKADPGQVEQVIMNLVVNARDAMPQGGKLTVETANVELDESYARSHFEVEPGRYAMLAVSDTGTGMDEATRARIFEPFFTTKGPGKGTGLGLATVFGIVKQSGGNVYVYSEPGQGATFKIYLPIVEEGPAAGKLLPGVIPTLHGTETVFLVEDEPAVRSLSRLTLQMYGYTVLEASQGDEALRVSEQHQGPIHLLLTDVVMPGMSGRQVAEALRLRYPAMKVLFVSGYTDDAVVRHGVLEGETAFLQKPFTPVALVNKLREVLDQ